ncbi:MAG: hypothetical protein PF439_00330 [Helicobacteraceae bacterium]|nr:hypothetical protein [Helicobacteraceae bacterium]
MNVLLVSNDAVVTKLVRLSTQKTGDRLDVATSTEAMRDENYDLLIFDATLFSREFLERLNDKIIYAHSIFITTRDSRDTDLFEKLLYKPFLPTELLIMLHHFAAQVKKEQDELSKEIVYEDFENRFFSDEEIVGGDDDFEQDALARVQIFEKITEVSMQEIAADEASEEDVLKNIFSEDEVSEVKAILDALSSDDDDSDEVLDESESVEEIDQELEKALRNLSDDDLALDMDDDVLMQLDDISTEELSWDEPQPLPPSSKQNQESIETLRTLLKALENPQLAKSLRGTITINLTFGED